jgi:hypothetical protein
MYVDAIFARFGRQNQVFEQNATERRERARLTGGGRSRERTVLCQIPCLTGKLQGILGLRLQSNDRKSMLRGSLIEIVGLRRRIVTGNESQRTGNVISLMRRGADMAGSIENRNTL